MASDGTKLYSTADAAQVLGVTQQHVQLLARRLGIGQKVGERAWVFTTADLERLRQRETKPGPKPKA